MKKRIVIVTASAALFVTVATLVAKTARRRHGR